MVTVLWPSLVLPDDDPTHPAPAGAPTGAQALAPVFPDQKDQLASLDHLIDTHPADPDQLEQAHHLISGLVTTPDAGAPEDAGMGAVATASTPVVFGHLESLAAPNTGDAQSMGSMFSGLWSGAKQALRVASYYEMKNRAGVVGQQGLGPLIGELQAAQPGLRVNLMGHSFGGRLVAFTLAGLPASAVGEASPVKSLLLIQAAFSHFAFADPMPIPSPHKKGALADFRDRVDGPLLCTFSAFDLAVGRWYPASSMINGDDAQSTNDLTYRWGAMGHDGYQGAGTEELVLEAVGKPYAVEKGKVYRLKSDAIICSTAGQFGAHSDINHDEVVWASLGPAVAGG